MEHDENTVQLKTVLYDKHINLGGKMVGFGGFLMPVQYPNGIIKEHMAVREKAGLFDVSHMGEFFFTGSDALANIQNLLTNDYSTMNIGQVKYSPMCYDNGGIVDDLLVYKMDEEKYMIVVNASNTAKDFEWMTSHAFGDVKMENYSDKIGLIALQGPNAAAILKKFMSEEAIPQKNYTFVDNIMLDGIKTLVSRTGYTGEDGFEFYVAVEDTPLLWDKLLAVGAEYGLVPCGLGARDTLRLEASMPLYGHELSSEITPLEAGLKMFVKLGKENFIGKTALVEKPIAKKRIGIELTGKGIAREGADIIINGEKSGFVSSGTLCPYLNKAVAMGYVTCDVELGQAISLDVRGRLINAKIIKLPFYKREK